jgi:hypothetical protein
MPGDPMKNITITLDAATAAWTRQTAAANGISVSRFVGELLQRQRRDGAAYQEAMRRFLSKPPVALKTPGDRYMTREEVHDRARLR